MPLLERAACSISSPASCPAGIAFTPKVLPTALERLSHLVFDQANNGCKDCTGYAAADCLTDEGSNIDAATRVGEHRQECSQGLATDASANCTCNGVANRSKAEIARRCTGGITANCASDDLIMRLMIIPDIGRPISKGCLGLFTRHNFT